MKINFPNGIIAEGTVSECEMLLSGRKKKIDRQAKPVKAAKYKSRRPWTGQEIAVVAQTLDLPVKEALKRLPGRRGPSLWQLRGEIRNNKLNPKLRNKLNAYLDSTEAN